MRHEPLPRVLTAHGARRLGFTEARVRTELRHHRWQRLAAGVLLTRPDGPTRQDWALAGAALAGASATLSGWDAVRLRGIGPPDPPTPDVLILTRAGHNRRVGRVRLRPAARPLRRTQLSVLDASLPEMWIASPARAVADCALDCRARAPVRAMVTAAVQRGLSTPHELAAELEAGPRQGSLWLRTALQDLTAGALSVAEAEAVELLHRVGVTGFIANAPLVDARGRVLFSVDLLWPELRAIVEIDSREFHFDELAWKRTMARHNALTRLGYALAHYPPSDIRRRGLDWAREVADWLAVRARTAQFS